MTIRTCRTGELPVIATIVNAAAERYRGVIPADRFHDPYMSEDELASEIAKGVIFWGFEDNGNLTGVMGLQAVKDRTLIRHAYVLPQYQGRGIGSMLLRFLIERQAAPMLVGTWADAFWAVRFYQRHGFVLTGRDETVRLLKTYWTIPERQIETSVVLTREKDLVYP